MASEIFVILGLILLNGLLALSEVVITSSRKSKLENLAKKGSKGAKVALDLASKPARFLSTIQVGITAIGILTGIFAGKGLVVLLMNSLVETGISAETSEILSYSIVVLSVTFLYLIFGELVPKRLGNNQPEKLARVFAPPVNAISQFVHPLIWVLTFSTDTILKIFGIKTQVDDVQITEEEVIELIAQGTNSGIIEEVEQDMMERVLLLGDRSVASLMSNRIEIEWIDINLTSDEILKQITDSNHSLFPVCDHELDKVLGIISSKKFLLSIQNGKNEPLRNLLDPVRVQGVLTQSDLFESIVAEHDTPDEENEISIVQRDEFSYLIDALLPFEEFLQYFEIEEVAAVDKTGFHSLGGFILHLSKQIPSTGDRFEWKNYEFEVVDMDGNRIDKLMMTIKNGESE